MFHRSYAPYVQVGPGVEARQEPFYMWTEVAGGQGAVNFITGMGGFLQAVLHGYLGVRAHLDRMEVLPRLHSHLLNVTSFAPSSTISSPS